MALSTRPERPVVSGFVVLAVVLALHVGAVSVSAQQDAIDLRPIWQEGQTSRYRIEQTERTQAQMAGFGEQDESEMLTEFAGEVTWRVIDASPNGGGRAEMVVEDLSMTLTNAQGETRRATPGRADEGLDPIADWLDALVGRPLTYTIEADGTIGGVRGFDAIQSRAGDVGAGMDEQYFLNLARDLAVLTGGPAEAGVGDRWNSSTRSSHEVGRIEADVTYEVAGFEELAGVPVVTVERTAELTLIPEILDEAPADGPDVDFRQSEGSASGFLWFDRSRNEIAGYYSTQTVGAEITISLPNGEQIMQTMTETTETEVLRIAEE